MSETVASAELFLQNLQEGVLASLEGWLSDSVIGKNPTLLLMAGIIYTHEQNYVEALKVTHTISGDLEL